MNKFVPTPLNNRRTTFRRCLVVTAVVLAGPALAMGCRGGEPAVDEIVSRVQAAQAKVESTHVTADIAFQMPGLGGPDMSMAMSIEQWMDGDKMRLEYVDGAPEMKGTVMVMNGDSLAMYMPATNQFVETAVPDIKEAGTSPGQAAAMTREWVGQILNTNSISFGGIEEVAGRRTYKLNAVPKATSEAVSDNGGISTLWVDAETFYPLKLDLAMGPMHMTMTTREVEYNPVVPPETFVLKAPPGAETSDVDLPQIETITVKDAQEKVTFDLLEAEAGATDFVLENTTVSAMLGTEGKNISVVIQTYRAAAGTINVQQMPSAVGVDLAGAMLGGEGARAVDVGSREASLASLGIAGLVLSWQEGETQIVLSGQVAEEDLLAFAASLR